MAGRVDEVMSHPNHALAREIVRQALHRHASPTEHRRESDDLLIVMGAVLEEVTTRPRSLRAQGGIWAGIATVVGVVAYGAGELSDLLGR